VATLVAQGGSGGPNTANLSTAQTGSAVSTNIVYKILRPLHPWRFLRITYSANTNVTSTADVWVF
jgi:hypothetical protein